MTELSFIGDALEDAFCAVSGIVITKANSNRLIKFIVPKTGASSRKHHNKPNLVLRAALTSNRTKDPILKELKNLFASTFLRSDSTSVLQWLRSSEKQPMFVCLFVATRVAETLHSSKIDQWGEIPGADIQADL